MVGLKLARRLVRLSSQLTMTTTVEKLPNEHEVTVQLSNELRKSFLTQVASCRARLE